MQTDLFGNKVKGQAKFNGSKKDTRPMPPEPNKNTCGNCIHLFRHQYSDKMKYCELYTQVGTAYGKLKIKSRDKACIKFEPKTK